MRFSKSSGIYKIQSKSHTYRVYIGSANNLKLRYYKHTEDLRNNKHHSPQLQRHFNKYGEDDIVFEIIETDDYLCKQHLLAREQLWYIPFEYENTEIPYFNCNKIAGSNKGMKMTKEAIAKIKNKLIGKKRGPMTAEHKKNWTESKIAGGKGNGLKGKPKAKETCLKISNTLKGRKQPPRTEEHKRHLSESLKGKKKSKEARINMSKAKKGKTPWNKGLKTGKQSPELIEKRIAPLRGRKQNKH